MIEEKNARGFTLLEVLIATLLVGVGIFAIMEAFNRGLAGVGEVEDYSLAVSLTQRRLETLKDTSFDSIGSVAKSSLSDFTDFEQQVDVTVAACNLKQITVTTYWDVPNGETNTSLSTYIVNS
jgi:prepilin-type N-terminal cleavage/methylation domain-containing protein